MKKKLKLSEIAVKSFITAETIKGGAAATLLNIACIHPPIPTDPVIGCDPRASILWYVPLFKHAVSYVGHRMLKFKGSLSETLFSNIVEKFQQTCPADARGILEYLPRSFTTFRMTVSNQHYSRTVFFQGAFFISLSILNAGLLTNNPQFSGLCLH